MSKEIWHAKRIKRITDKHAIAIFAQTRSMAKVPQIVWELSEVEMNAILHSAYMLAEAALAREEKP